MSSHSLTSSLAAKYAILQAENDHLKLENSELKLANQDLKEDIDDRDEVISFLRQQGEYDGSLEATDEQGHEFEETNEVAHLRATVNSMGSQIEHLKEELQASKSNRLAAAAETAPKIVMTEPPFELPMRIKSSIRRTGNKMFSGVSKARPASRAVVTHKDGATEMVDEQLGKRD
ncbi:hypothetical protein NX059_001059 [Plenodomus lindquistii]|nr:hypothetical protein NX059_001059 [Plenodomus lindquistii]